MSQPDIPRAFWDHVDELRLTVLKILITIGVGTALALFNYQFVFKLLTSPFENNNLTENAPQLILLGPAEGITTVFKIAFWTGLCVTSPIWLFFLFQFIAPALQKREKSLVVPFFLFSTAFSSFGALFAYYITIPFANRYLILFNESLGQNLWSLANYLDYTLIILLGNALAFETNVILLFLVHYRWISAKSMIAKRKIIIVLAFIVGAILTPPDVLSQVLLAIPLIGFYEAAICYARFRERKCIIEKFI